MHFTLKKTLSLIIESGNDFVIPVKANQPILMRTLEHYTKNSTPVQRTQDTNRSRGRQEERRITLWYNDVMNQELALLGWHHIKSVFYLERCGTRNAQSYHEGQWYISSIQKDSREFLSIARLHWQIENNLHRVKDVVLKEDSTATRNYNANRVLAILRNIVINVFRKNGFSSLKYAIEKFTNRIQEQFSFLLRT